MGVFIMKRFIKSLDILLAILCVFVFSFVAIGEKTMPSAVVCYDSVNDDISSIYSYGSKDKVSPVDMQSSYPTQETLKLLGVIPVKNITVTNKSSSDVYIGGDAFGIKLYTDGVIVVGTQAVDLDNGSVNPAEDAGINVGDIIIEINNKSVYTSTEVIDILNDNNGEPYKIKVKRGERYRTFTLNPVYSNKEGCYKAGMWVRDSTAGIGTVTFFNDKNKSFGALGHQINDVDTKEIMPMLEGEAVKAKVTGVQKANSGSTGSLICDFSNESIGKLVENTSCGVFGFYNDLNPNLKKCKIASAQEIEKGRAQIISTIDSNGARAYDIEITHTNYNGGGEKDIVFKIVDEELLSKTGGIVQGMSGSPIIQNDKLIGAVTHVIINNPKKGYAIFAQTMLEQSMSINVE